MMSEKNLDPTRGATKVPASSSVGALFTWIGTRGDYSSVERKDKATKGWMRKVHPATVEGRFTVVIATWLTAAAFGVYVWRRRASTKEKESRKHVTSVP